jgi:nucleoid-associated protein YgaU
MAASKPTPTVVDKFKFYESEISTVFGFVVVVVIGVALLFFLRRATLKPAPALVDLGATTTSENLMKDQASPTPKPGTYVVKPGDHLWKIAQAQLQDGYQWTTIAKANGIKAPFVVREGQTLTIPAADPTIAKKMTKAESMQPVAKTSENPAAVASGSYTVKKSDNLWKIAVAQYKDGYKWMAIYKANVKTIGKNPGVIRAGQVLVIPSTK